MLDGTDGLGVATAYHLVRTLTYEGYLVRQENGSYLPGLEVAKRYRELAAAYGGPAAVGMALRRAARGTGITHVLARFVAGRVAITAVATGFGSPRVEEFVPGFHEAAHATAWGQALLGQLLAG
jgi:DNA-binding IclR family transcriptional regulator